LGIGDIDITVCMFCYFDSVFCHCSTLGEAIILHEWVCSHDKLVSILCTPVQIQLLCNCNPNLKVLFFSRKSVRPILSTLNKHLLIPRMVVCDGNDAIIHNGLNNFKFYISYPLKNYIILQYFFLGSLPFVLLKMHDVK
jgi:hypothetical protein